MSQKLITDLQLRDSFSDDVNFPVQDSVQTYRNTGAQVADFLSGLQNRSPSYMKNISIFVSASSGALNVSMRQADGISHPGSSSSSRSEAAFRSTTLTSGALVVRQYTSQMASMSIVIPSGATLGSMAGQEFLAYVYLYYDGTADGICISTSRLDETVLHNISAISGNSNSTGVYATDSTTNAAVRLIGGIRWNSISTPGTWVTPSAVFTTHFENGLRTRSTTGTSVGIGGVAISEDSGFYTQTTNSYETVTNLSVTLETTGRPVFVGLIGNTHEILVSSVIFVSDEKSIINGACRFRRGSTTISQVDAGISTVLIEHASQGIILPPTSFWCLDLAPAGTHTYTFQVRTFESSGQFVRVLFSRLMAYEL